MKTNATISVVIPFLNEEENLPELYSRLKAVFAGRSGTAEFLFVDDGSTDGSFQILEKIAAEDSRVRKLQLSRNFGHQAAITAGLDYASGDAVIIMDADLQDPPEVLPDLLTKWNEGFEVVYAVRRKRDGEGFLKKLLAAGFYRFFRAMCSVKVPVDAGDFRLLDRGVVEALKTMRETHRYMRGMTSWIGFRQCAVEYDRAARHAGETKYPIWKSLKLAWDGITSFSGKPLQWMMNLGLLIALVSALFAFRIIWMKISGNGELVSGWASLSVLVLFLGGVQLVALGLLGQYISRIFDESKKRPIYVVRKEDRS
jgi:polyisoprenyl-phosphate glycosyltransferase